MADQLERNTRAPNPDVETDDPLAELARIIGYERPEDKDVAPEASREAEASDFDLESELMRELDVLPLDGFDELDESRDLPPSVAVEPEAAELDVAPENQPFDEGFELDSSWLDNKPEDSSEVTLEDPFEGPDTDAAAPLAAGLAEDDGSNAEAGLVGWDAVDADISGDAETGGPDLEAFFEPEQDQTAITGMEAAQPADATPVAEDSRQDVAQPAAPSSPDLSDDDVLADIFKYELPDHGDGSESAPKAAAESAGQVSQAEPAAMVPQALGSASEPELNDGAEWPGAEAEAGPVETADASEFSDVAIPDGTERDVRPAEIDFEDYLSAELDVFEHQVSMDPANYAPFGGNDEPVEQTGSATAPVGPEGTGYEADAVIEAGVAGDADTQLDDPFALEDDFLFDEAAEDLLADFAQDDAIARAAVENEFVEDNFEAGVSEEMSDELEDLFGAPEPGAISSGDDAGRGGELEFDLEQVLAEAVVDPELAAANPVSDGAQAAMAMVEEPAVAETLDDYGYETDKDEMAEAFKDLMMEETPGNQVVNNASQPVESMDQVDGDWLSGIETEPDSESAADEGFFFDSGMITEPEETVEAVNYIDVPDLPDDEPQSVDPDFESEIERDFADILEPEIAPVASRSNQAAVGGVGAESMVEPGWGQNVDAAARAEQSNDYAALERELGDGDLHVSPPYQTAGDGVDAPRSSGSGFDGGPQESEAAQQSGSRGPVVALAVLGLAVLAGVGAFGWSIMSGGESAVDDGPRIIRADKEPVKVLPENPGGVTVPNQDKAVYDRVAGGDGTQSGQPSLVNTAEEPIDVVQRTLDPDVLPLEGRNEEPTVKSEERLTADGASDAAAGVAAGAPVVSPRRVRTMVVRPDGSIVAREEGTPETVEPAAETAGQAAEPAAGAAETAQETAAAADPVPTAPATAAPAGESTEVALAEPTAQPSSEGTVAPVRVVTTQPIRAPVPQGRPAEQPVNVVGTVTQGGNVAAPSATAPAAPTQPVEAATQPVEVASAPAAPAANPGGYYVQIASQPTAEGAQASWQTLSSRYSSVLGGRSVDIQRADIPGKGIFHRVRIPAGERSEANALCNRYKAAGGSCFVSR
ncbi:Sporulation related domain protein [Hoeflea phototrophica DFL-43]|uniref:Sporulation related domain protein n=1 Tax=Hoeflea phototrophica (strain DSM 17068 / NCIMB 14078 / DFL-43) TaxID=411684 RepID=A9D5P5_HOEPD|nr:SPOR domain-containing protein [Hoeflea phototrophica]EDQ33337.1 Sporulation related domain protein [Hoeflea phototrophica DFL-43]